MAYDELTGRYETETTLSPEDARRNERAFMQREQARSGLSEPNVDPAERLTQHLKAFEAAFHALRAAERERNRLDMEIAIAEKNLAQAHEAIDRIYREGRPAHVVKTSLVPQSDWRP